MRRTIDEQRSHALEGFDRGISLTARTKYLRDVDADMRAALEMGFFSLEEYLDKKEEKRHASGIRTVRLRK